MDDHIKVMEELFSAAKTELKNMEHYYFHNCLYEGVWKENKRRWTDQLPTAEVLNKFPKDWKCIFVGDASMSPYEIAYPGGASEHWNEEAGEVWLKRAIDKWPSCTWINPVPERQWKYTHSIQMIQEIFGGRMHPMTLEGLGAAMKELSR